MISRKTVFVLGAGASNPYGFPLGWELKRDVLAQYAGQTGRVVHILNTTALGTPEVATFIDGLRYSGLSSVDAFLERRPNFLDIGKATMGVELLFKEATANLWQDGSNWLVYLYNTMIGSSAEEFATNEVSFITFNYDRTVEHFLHTALQNTFGKSAEETAQVVKQIPIIHLHGRLGFLPWQEGHGVTIPFGLQNIDSAAMDTMLRQIKVVHEDIADGRDQDFALAKQRLAQAERVYLFGFGFGARNVERLGLASIGARDYRGTAYGMTSKEMAQCSQLCGGRVVLDINHDTLSYLRNFAALD